MIWRGRSNRGGGHNNKRREKTEILHLQRTLKAQQRCHVHKPQIVRHTFVSVDDNALKSPPGSHLAQCSHNKKMLFKTTKS